MTAWTHALTLGQFMFDVAVVGGLLLAGVAWRRYVAFFQRYLIPANLIAGFAGLILGPELLGWLDFSLERMGVYVYHLLALTFIGVGLQGGMEKPSRGALHLGFIQIMTFLLQALVGLAVILGMVYLIDPGLVPAAGMLLPLGFGMGPGIAYTIGQSWEAYGFPEGGAIGLTVAAIGFLVAYFTGIALVRRGIRRGHAALVREADTLDAATRTGVVQDQPPVAARLTFMPGAVEPLTVHLALIAVLYLGTYGLTRLLAAGLTAAGLAHEVPTLWSFHFILANLLAFGLRRLMRRRRVDHLLDEGFLHRITGVLCDFLIAASIMAISLRIAWNYLGPILLMCAVGTVVTYVSIKYVAQRVFADYPFERFVGIYGEMTGTISSGLALVRVADPELATPVAQDLVLSSGLALAFGFPLLVVINLPFTAFGGALTGYGVVAGIVLAYLVFLLLLWRRFGLRRQKVRPF
ncbi:MAG: hypothetical protein KatS3mg042_0380 [Rhodothermaceae bacterium]|nr:MAG: hypothetical protein KatS3mg042_0380 [Rhodothermaceae bacterium]